MSQITLDIEDFKILASETRLDILRAIDQKNMSLKDISDVTKLHETTVHEHLTKLINSGYVKKDEREGHKCVYYNLTWKGSSLLHPDNTKAQRKTILNRFYRSRTPFTNKQIIGLFVCVFLITTTIIAVEFLINSPVPGKIFASDGTINDSFGNAVALSGDTAVIGAIGDSDKGYLSGSAYVFIRNETT